MIDLILRNARLLNGQSTDIGIDNGVIVAIEPDKRYVILRGKLVAETKREHRLILPNSNLR